MHNRPVSLLSVSLCATLVVTALPSPASAQPVALQRAPRVIQLDPGATKASDVLNGPPETCTMRSGYMVLAPTASVGRHSTGGNEEAVIVLAGRGEMRITGGPTLQLQRYSIAYCPPVTEHDVVNTGSDTLRYIWLVAKAQP
jgi:quercetin dioxygenase-like cupin family protein